MKAAGSRGFSAEYDEMGGYDCMSAAWRILDPDGKVVAEVDLCHYDAPNGSGTDARRLQIEGEARALKYAEAIVRCLNNEFMP